jgi:diguanylate cyclase (GGDEF)-like protein
MIGPSIPNDESARLQDLKKLKILDTPIHAGFERITRLAQNLFRVPFVAISLIDENRQWFKSEQGLGTNETPRDISFCGHTILQDEFFIVPDTQLDSRFADNPLVIEEPHLRFYAGYPLYSPKGYKYGAICIGDSCPRSITKEEILPLRDLAALVETEVLKFTAKQAQDKLLSELDSTELASLVDPLTRRWNHQGMLKRLERNFSMSQQTHHPFTIALLDIDNFKKTNEAYGYSMGDRVLRSLAKTMVSSCRETDDISRWGGEVFLLRLGDTNGEEAQLIADRIRSKVEQERYQAPDKNQFNITVSVGVTTVSFHDNLQIDDYIQQAEQALKLSKKSGGNKVVAYSLGWK